MSFNYLFVSDMHLSEGKSPLTGKLHRNEDFFHDVGFAQFLAYHARLTRQTSAPDFFEIPWKLIINGDLFDFLQVVSLPPVDEDLATLNVVDSDGRSISVRKTLSRNEKLFGLGTTQAEIVWKLDRIAEGHPLFFEALGWFVAHGHQLVINKGNHDVELFWPAVQVRFRQLLTESYATWRKRAGVNESTPLALYNDSPDELTMDWVETAVLFPDSFHIEDGIFYAEHGCQYDPANWFPNIVDPRLPDKPTLLELPSGSLFVRYFFNDVEHVHPFADNMQPISKYLFWLIRNAPVSVFQFLTNLLPNYLSATRKVVGKKKDGPVNKSRRNPESQFEENLLAIQERVRGGMLAGTRNTQWRMILSIVLVLATAVLGLAGIRLLAIGNFVWMTAVFAMALTTYFISSYLFQSVDHLLGRPYLSEAAEQIASYLNQDTDPDFDPVPFYIYGHNHSSDIRPLPSTLNGRRQWYVNTGAWVPTFNEQARLLRGDFQLTFVRIIPSRMKDVVDGVPELLQWSPHADAPRPVRLFDE